MKKKKKKKLLKQEKWRVWKKKKKRKYGKRTGRVAVFIKLWNTLAVSSTGYIVDTQLCKLRNMSRLYPTFTEFPKIMISRSVLKLPVVASRADSPKKCWSSLARHGAVRSSSIQKPANQKKSSITRTSGDGKHKKNEKKCVRTHAISFCLWCSRSCHGAISFKSSLSINTLSWWYTIFLIMDTWFYYYYYYYFPCDTTMCSMIFNIDHS